MEIQFRPDQNFENAHSWASKFPGAAIRLAGVSHSIQFSYDNPAEHWISLETMRATLNIISVISQHSLYAMEIMGADSGSYVC